MPRLHETQMGSRLFSSTLPRLVTALEKLVTVLDKEGRLEILEIAVNLPSAGKVECRDGFTFMLVSSDVGYDVSLCTEAEVLLQKYYKGGVDCAFNKALGVPATTVAEVIFKHGGLVI